MGKHWVILMDKELVELMDSMKVYLRVVVMVVLME
jgi:hypothetical protein